MLLAWCLALCICWLAAGSARAQSAPVTRASAVKAAFLYHFARFVEWPPGTFRKPDEPLVIAVSGDAEVAADLEQLVSGRTIDGRPVAVRRVAQLHVPEDAHVLYLGQRRENRLREALHAVAGPVLVVTEQSGALQLGSVLNFVTDMGRVRFSASLASADARNLRLSARLLAVAQAIEGRIR